MGTRARPALAPSVVLVLALAGTACTGPYDEAPEPPPFLSAPDPTEPGDPGGPDPFDPPPAGARSRAGDYPGLCAFIGQWERYTEAEKDTIARFDVVSLRAGPTDVAELRGRNPDVRLFYRVMPQLVGATDWVRDWSWMDVVRRYAVANDWILRHDDGSEAIARGWGTYWRWLDFTSRCPLGTHVDPQTPALDSSGLTAAEWTATRFIPWFVTTRADGYEGLWWEVVAEVPAKTWFYNDVTDENGMMLDWDRNGVGDFREDGWDAWYAFEADWAETASWWIEEVRSRLGYDYPIIAGGDASCPALTYFHGHKNEDFLNRNRWNGAAWTWWDEFYTHTIERPRRGYVLQRDRAIGGWDLAVNQIFWYDDEHWQFSDGSKMRRYVRFALGTTLLGDGLFAFYDLENPIDGQPRIPWVPSVYDLALGSHAYDMQKRVVGRDTLYTRHFHDGAGNLTGMVAVNPYDTPLAGIPARDALIEGFGSTKSRSLDGARPIR